MSIVPQAYGGASVAAADLNGDGKLDLAVTVNGALVVRMNDGSGAFPRETIYTFPADSQVPVSPGIAAADFDADGRVDIATLRGVFMNEGGGSLQLKYVYPLAMRELVGAADVTGDGLPDIIERDPEVWIHASTGGGNFAPRVRIIASQVQNVSTGDLNSDGKIDLVVSSGNRYDAYLNQGGTTFTVTQSPVSASPSRAFVRDIDASGAPDLVALTFRPISTSLNVFLFEVFANQGGGVLSPPVFQRIDAYDLGTGADMNVEDLDGDGLPDIAVSDSGGLTFFWNGPPGVFTRATSRARSTANSRRVFADLNGDGAPDLISPTYVSELKESHLYVDVSFNTKCRWHWVTCRTAPARRGPGF